MRLYLLSMRVCSLFCGDIYHLDLNINVLVSSSVDSVRETICVGLYPALTTDH